MVNDDWILSQTLFGITTYYRREPDNSLSIKLEGELRDVPVFEQICVLKEVDLHCQWAPFCSSSMTLEELDKLDMVGWFVLGLPHLGLARDACFRAVGCDSMAEDGSFLLVGQGVHDRAPNDPPPVDSYLCDDPLLNEVDIPNPPTSLGSGRMTIRFFEAIVKILSPTHVTTRLVANVNPNLKFIPQSLLDFLMKKLCGVMLLKLQGAAKKILKNPIRNPHARKMRENPDFYKNWLLAKIEFYCRTKGWEIPKVVAFDALENRGDHDTLTNGTPSAALLQFHSTSELDEMLENAQSGRNYGRAHSAPVLDFSTSRDDSDAMSGISAANSTDTVKSSNPIVMYMREIEEKTKKRKEAKVAEARQRAADRLKPKDFSTDQNARLEELKQAKARRVEMQEKTRPTVRSVGSSSTNTPETVAKKASVQSRGQSSRLVTIFALVTVLFALLYSHSVVDPGLSFTSNDQRWASLGQGLSTVAYIGVCALIHFYLSEVVLVYAFDSLELGVKSGFEARKYYSDNIRVAVAVVSAGIVLLSITKALTDVGLRGMIWSLNRLFRWIQPRIRDIISSVVDKASKMVPSVVQNWVATGDTIVWTSFQVVADSVHFVCALVFGILYKVLISSNVFGNTAELLVVSTVNTTASFVTSGSTLFSDITRSDGELLSWRIIAVDTSRALFSYTSVFLLTSVALFKFMVATNSQPTTRRDRSVALRATPLPPSPHDGQISMNGGAPRKLKTTTTRYPTIPEEERESELISQTPIGASTSREVASTTSPVNDAATSQTEATTAERKRRRLFPRLRLKSRSSHETEASPNVDTKSRERRRFRKSVTN